MYQRLSKKFEQKLNIIPLREGGVIVAVAQLVPQSSMKPCGQWFDSWFLLATCQGVLGQDTKTL